MNRSNTILKISAIFVLFVTVFAVGCDNNNTDADFDAPTVLSTSPDNNAVNVVRNQVITVKFSEAMNSSSINSNTFTLKQGSTSIQGEVTYNDSIATFTPTNTLSSSDVFMANISTGAQSALGESMDDNYEWSFSTAGTSEPIAVVDLGTAGNYVVLAKSAINNNPTSAITGDLGLSPAATTFITGFGLTNDTGYATSDQVTGRVYAADMATPTPVNLTTAVENMTTAYNDAAGRVNPDFFELYEGNLGGKTLSPGLYKWTNTVLIPTDITISGSENEVWIFQIAENLTLSSAVNMTLTGGAKAENIFWQVAGEVTVGTNSHFEGVILSMTGITLNSAASLNGRMLAQTAVILDGNAVVQP